MAMSPVARRIFVAVFKRIVVPSEARDLGFLLAPKPFSVQATLGENRNVCG
jgi:hypothetical protein